jgi:hypothetical protein
MKFSHLIQSPLYQGILVIVLMIFILIFFRILRKPIAGWNASVLLLLLFCLINSITGIFISNIGVYILESIGIFVFLFASVFVLSSLLSGIKLAEYGESAMLFLAPIIYYPVLMVIMLLVRQLL